jgi:hypothetical protein
MSSFNTSTFVIAGTAIAIAGVGLYLWDTRKDQVVAGLNSLKMTGGSRRHRKRCHKNTKRRH